MRYFVFLIIILTALSCQEEEGDVLEGLLKKNKDKFAKVLSDSDKYEVQILYTQINRDTMNTPTFTTFSYQVDPNNYFYPASVVKLPIAILALEKLNTLYKFKNIPATKNTAIRIDSLRSPQTSVQFDATSPTGLPTVGHYVNKLFTVSDNDGKRIQQKAVITTNAVTQISVFDDYTFIEKEENSISVEWWWF